MSIYWTADDQIESVDWDGVDGVDGEDEEMTLDAVQCSMALLPPRAREGEIGKVGRKMAMLNKCPLPASADQKGKKERRERRTQQQNRSDQKKMPTKSEQCGVCVCAAVAAL